MRLIDADALEEAVQGAINIMESHGISMISASIPMAIIKGAHTIDAIPVEWLKEQIAEVPDSLWASLIESVMNQWKKEQEAR